MPLIRCIFVYFLIHTLIVLNFCILEVCGGHLQKGLPNNANSCANITNVLTVYCLLLYVVFIIKFATLILLQSCRMFTQQSLTDLTHVWTCNRRWLINSGCSTSKNVLKQTTFIMITRQIQLY